MQWIHDLTPYPRIWASEQLHARTNQPNAVRPSVPFQRARDLPPLLYWLGTLIGNAYCLKWSARRPGGETRLWNSNSTSASPLSRFDLSRTWLGTGEWIANVRAATDRCGAVPEVWSDGRRLSRVEAGSCMRDANRMRSIRVRHSRASWSPGVRGPCSSQPHYV